MVAGPITGAAATLTGFAVCNYVYFYKVVIKYWGE